jgi:integrase
MWKMVLPDRIELSTSPLPIRGSAISCDYSLFPECQECYCRKGFLLYRSFPWLLAITKRLIDSLKPRAREYFVWDASLPGYGVRVQPTGAKSLVLKYRAGSGRTAPTRRITLVKEGTVTPDEGRTLAKKMLGSIAHGADPAAQRAADKRASTLSEVAEQFLREHVEAKRSSSSAGSYRDLLERLALPELGKRKAGKITTAEIQRLHSKNAHTPYQANRLLRVLSSLFTFAGKTHAVPIGFNPCRGIEYFPEKGRERYLTTAELARLGEAIREAETIGLPYAVDQSKPTAKYAPKEANRRTVIGPHAAAALRLLIFTGARLREILHLKWDYIDFERGLLLLPTSKTGKKTIVLNAPALAILSGLPRASEYVIAGTFPDQPRADLKKPWKAVSNRAGLTGVRIHDLRHTHASVGAGAGLGLPIIGKLLGHAQSATTQRYAHLDADPLRKASEHIGSQLASAMGERSGPDADIATLQIDGRSGRSRRSKDD